MKNYFLLACLFLSFASCYFYRPLSLAEIEEVESNSVQNFRLYPATESHHKRIDLIRQTETETDSNDDCETVDVDYHPLGFDLGNGLFFDLNGNLSLRIDSLLGIQKGENYRIRQTDWSAAPRVVFYEDEQYCYSRQAKSGQTREFCTGQIEYKENGLQYFWNDNLQYSIEEKEDTTTLTYRLFQYSVHLFKERDNHFFTKGLFNDRNYSIDNGVLNLRNRYTIQHNPQTKAIEIYTRGLRRNRLSHQIKIGEDAIILYGNTVIGKKITYSEDGFAVYHGNNQNPVLQMEKLPW